MWLLCMKLFCFVLHFTCVPSLYTWNLHYEWLKHMGQASFNDFHNIWIKRFWHMQNIFDSNINYFSDLGINWYWCIFLFFVTRPDSEVGSIQTKAPSVGCVYDKVHAVQKLQKHYWSKASYNYVIIDLLMFCRLSSTIAIN